MLLQAQPFVDVTLRQMGDGLALLRAAPPQVFKRGRFYADCLTTDIADCRQLIEALPDSP